MPKIAVLVSGSGTNLQAIIDAVANKELDCKIVVVIADRDCLALSRAKLSGISTHLIERKLEKNNLSAKINECLDFDCDLIILAGFLSILDAAFTKRWENKIINIHPSLLPKYGGNGMWGIKVHQAVINNREQQSGCTIHFVNSEIDGGTIIHQQVVPVLPEDDAESLQKRVQQVEHKALITAVQKLLDFL